MVISRISSLGLYASKEGLYPDYCVRVRSIVPEIFAPEGQSPPTPPPRDNRPPNNRPRTPAPMICLYIICLYVFRLKAYEILNVLYFLNVLNIYIYIWNLVMSYKLRIKINRLPDDVTILMQQDLRKDLYNHRNMYIPHFTRFASTPLQ